jgi:hypothetical protein
MKNFVEVMEFKDLNRKVIEGFDHSTDEIIKIKENIDNIYKKFNTLSAEALDYLKSDDLTS